MITMQAIQIMVISGSLNSFHVLRNRSDLLGNYLFQLIWQTVPKGPQTLVIKGAWTDYGT